MPDFPKPPAPFNQRSFPKGVAPTSPEGLELIYAWMHLARITDERLLELFRQGKVAGTVAGGQGNEGLIVPLALLADKEIDVISITHRGLGGQLIWGKPLPTLIAQYFANEFSPTLGREGNVHHGDPANRSYPMISHLGTMSSNVVGGADSQRRKGHPAVGITFFGDGASSTGDIHETLNWAARFHIPVLFIIENNEYAYSTPVSEQYTVSELASRAAGYGIQGLRASVTDLEALTNTLASCLETVRSKGEPVLLEVATLRLRGHAAYDTGEYIPEETKKRWAESDPLPRLRQHLIDNGKEDFVQKVEETASRFLEDSLKSVVRGGPPPAENLLADVYSPTEAPRPKLEPVTRATEDLNFAEAVRQAQERILADDPTALLIGQDIAGYGGAFRTTAGLLDRFGPERVLNAPVAESAMIGYATGLAINGHRPIVEFQFADFATDATTQITLNAGTYHFRSGASVPMVLRFPCGGGLTFGSFHSQDLEALYLHMPGLKLLYPSTPNDVYHALIAAWADPDPVLVFEHKGLYRKAKGPVDFQLDSSFVWSPRTVREGSLATVLAWGEMVGVTEQVADVIEDEFEESIELIDCRSLRPFQWGPIEASLRKTGRLAVVHEARRDGGRGAELVAEACQQFWPLLSTAPLRVGSKFMPVPFAPNLEASYRPGIDSLTEDFFNWLESAP